MVNIRFVNLLVLCSLTLSNYVLGEEIRFDTAIQWNQWKLPNGIVEVTDDGYLRLLPIGRDIDAVNNARSFGGGTHAALLFLLLQAAYTDSVEPDSIDRYAASIISTARMPAQPGAQFVEKLGAISRT